MFIEFPLVIAAFLAGIFMFLAPCTLPLVPGYLAFISGTSLQDLSNPKKQKKARRNIFFNGLFYVLGFSIVFVGLGSLAGLVGGVFESFREWFVRIAGVFVVIFGLFMMKVVKIPFLDKEFDFNAPALFKKGTPTNSFLLGASFAMGWTPCIGPVLGSILTIASTSATALKGAVLLSVFSLGLGIPFLIIAIGIGSASRILKKISKYLHIISFVGGVFLVILGILLLTDNMSLLIIYGFQVFDFIDYESLLRFL